MTKISQLDHETKKNRNTYLTFVIIKNRRTFSCSFSVQQISDYLQGKSHLFFRKSCRTCKRIIFWRYLIKLLLQMILYRNIKLYYRKSVNVRKSMWEYLLFLLCDFYWIFCFTLQAHIKHTFPTNFEQNRTEARMRWDELIQALIKVLKKFLCSRINLDLILRNYTYDCINSYSLSML